MHLSIKKKQKNNTKSNDILPFLYGACIIFERESMCSFKKTVRMCGCIKVI